MPEKFLRDPVHGSIGFDKTREKLVTDLINTREFQRLRRIRQLGALFLTFHGAEHTRFTHSVGVAWMAKRLFDALHAQGQIPLRPKARERTRLVAIVAALLHDLGHGPFSHLYEKVFNDRQHEEWTRLIIRSPGSEVGKLLRRAGMTEEVLAVYDRRYRPAFVSDIVASQLDADRLDYLLRDSLMTGVAYGKYDLEWILINLRLARRGRGRDGDLRLCLNAAKGYHAAEQFIIARYLMYQQVYYHKTARAAEQMIRMALQRLVDAHRVTGRYPEPCAPPIRRLIETRANLSPEEYLRLDDWLFLSAFKEWAEAPARQVDPILKDLCDRITWRRLFKTVRLTADTKHRAYTQAIQALQAQLRERGFDPQYYLLEDDATDLPYRDLAYSDRLGRAPEDIGLARNGIIAGYMSERTVSPLIDSIRNEPRKIHRLCFPAEMRAVVERRLRPFISHERQ
jgi:HD superfamily phosphohydrolase